MMHTSSNRGYSLLELIVSLGIFSVIMLIATGAYLSLISLDRHARASNQLSATLSFAVESMARSLRTGSNYACNASASAPNCTSGGTSISFRDSEGQTVTYRLRADGSIGQCTGGLCTDASAIPLTDSRIAIDTLRFYVRGVGNDYVQPQVTFVVSGTMTTDEGEQASFSIQTGATQRLIEL
jgi:prepilin-type N-terminal cleavage/methylation domain-containing protein